LTNYTTPNAGAHAQRTSVGSPFAVLAAHPQYAVARELAAEARPRRRRYFGPKVEALNPHYAYASRNEQSTLEELVAALPPHDGMAAYIADLNDATYPAPQLTDREVALRARWWE
jgi:hypothetical protein